MSEFTCRGNTHGSISIQETHPAEAVGLNDEGAFAETVCAAQQLVLAPVVGEGRHPAVVDPEADLVGMQGWAFQEVRDGGLLPSHECIVKAAHVSSTTVFQKFRPSAG